MAKSLTGFEITRDGETYRLRFELDGGETVELTASYEQLDLIAEEIDRQLDADEEDVLSADETD
ncbi:hypothetical protein [Sphingomonas morindae]|uniref:Uncharacterized protein n=1 Tax=Sphingomonas morindae TaxID=1541170 RepID=A0ABY4XAT2_9SPHN|nr:hypothetical protein [Sphingomonas morindae]USI74068.1 hypothetical protein LHA26_06295 [Sphingomonas morindae]